MLSLFFSGECLLPEPMSQWRYMYGSHGISQLFVYGRVQRFCLWKWVALRLVCVVSMRHTKKTFWYKRTFSESNEQESCTLHIGAIFVFQFFGFWSRTFLIITYFMCLFVVIFCLFVVCWLKNLWADDKTRVMEHPGASNNYDKYEKICKMKFSKTKINQHKLVSAPNMKRYFWG